MIEIFENKSVAFVGQAPTLEGKGLGDEIDSFDVVYRTNYIPKNVEDFGMRCDVISVLKDHFNLLPTHNVQNVILFDDTELDRNKYIVTVSERNRIRSEYFDSYGLDIIDATAGLVAYYLATKFGATKFKFYGITGYQNTKSEVVNHSEINHYTEEYYKATGGKEFVMNIDMKNYDCHNFKNQNDLFKILLENGMIEMDKYSLEYFK